MGYRSDIRIVVSNDGFEELKKFVKQYLKENDEDYNLLESLDVNKKGKNQYYLGWNSLKWYEGSYKDVDAIMEGLEHLEEQNYSYRYMRIGEDREDYDDRYFDSERKSEPYLEYPCMIREFDDNYVEKSIAEYIEEFSKENKEDIDI